MIKKNIILISILILSSTLGVILWDFIKIPFNFEIDYGGEYLNKKYNFNNDLLRFIFFILISLTPFFIFFYKFYENKIFKIKEYLNLKTSKSKDEKKYFYLLIFFFILICSLQFFSIDFTNWISPVDLFHSGLWITSSYNYIKTNNFWSDSYVARGLVGNFYPILIWKIVGKISIGAVSLVDLISTYLNKVLLVFLAYNITKNIQFIHFRKIIFFIFLTLLFLSLDPWDNLGNFVKRSPIIILFLNIFLISFEENKKFLHTTFILGIFSAGSFLWYLDVGFYLNSIIFLIVIFYLIRQEYYKLFHILFGILIGWLLVFIIFEAEELNAFIWTSKNIFLTMDQIQGQIYPTPFFSGDTRATKALIYFVLGGIFTIFICFKKNEFSNNNKFFFLFLFILSLISFKTGLSRSDSPHIKSSLGPLMIILYTYLLYLLFNINFSKIFNKNILILIVSAILLFNFNFTKINNLKFSKKNLVSLINATDEFFLREKNIVYNDIITYFKKNFPNLECIQVLNDDILLPYLLRIKSCTKYYNPWNVTPLYLQKEFVNDLIMKKPLIIFAEDKNIYTPNLKFVEKYVYENYKVIKKIDRFKILKLN